MRIDIELSVVLVERSAVVGLDTHALADYATMRMLANIEAPEGKPGTDTVLTLFSEGAENNSANRMTTFDAAYLRALYRSNPAGPAKSALGTVAANMKKALGEKE